MLFTLSEADTERIQTAIQGFVEAFKRIAEEIKNIFPYKYKLIKKQQHERLNKKNEKAKQTIATIKVKQYMLKRPSTVKRSHRPQYRPP